MGTDRDRFESLTYVALHEWKIPIFIIAVVGMDDWFPWNENG
jgi:hypothetical protein